VNDVNVIFFDNVEKLLKVNDKPVRIQIYNILGFFFSVIVILYDLDVRDFEDTNVFILCFSIADRMSFQNIESKVIFVFMK
jgi:hypothetical protein